MQQLCGIPKWPPHVLIMIGNISRILYPRDQLIIISIVYIGTLVFLSHSFKNNYKERYKKLGFNYKKNLFSSFTKLNDDFIS